MNGTEQPGEEGAYFRSPALLVLANRLVCALVAFAVLLIRGDTSELRNKAPLPYYLMISVSNFCATMCLYQALKWVTFSTQTLAKCAKMIPVMIWGTVLSGKSYSGVEYAGACIIGLGCTIFLVSGDIMVRYSANVDGWVGLVLILGYLVFEGLTCTLQEKLFKDYNISICNQVLYVNLCSSVLAIFLLATSGDFWSSLKFVREYPSILRDMSLLSLSTISGQLAITYTIKELGALLYATIMTISQSLFIFMSNIIFMHGMNLKQLFGATMVFGALFCKSFYKADRHRMGSRLELEAISEPLISSCDNKNVFVE